MLDTVKINEIADAADVKKRAEQPVKKRRKGWSQFDQRYLGHSEKRKAAAFLSVIQCWSCSP